jgi:hypothetical protein
VSEEQIKKLHNRCKSFEFKNTHLVCQIAALNENPKPAAEHPGTSDKSIITPPTTETAHPNDNPTTTTTITTTETRRFQQPIDLIIYQINQSLTPKTYQQMSRQKKTC